MITPNFGAKLTGERSMPQKPIMKEGEKCLTDVAQKLRNEYVHMRVGVELCMLLASWYGVLFKSHHLLIAYLTNAVILSKRERGLAVRRCIVLYFMQVHRRLELLMRYCKVFGQKNNGSCNMMSTHISPFLAPPHPIPVLSLSSDRENGGYAKIRG